MRKKLKEVCDFYSGTGFPVKYQGEDDGELPFYKVGDIANNATAGNVYLSLCNNFISHEVAKEIKGTIIPANVVVFAKIGEALKLNRRAITACDCLIDNNAMGIGGKSEYLNSMYFYFYMKNLKMEKLAESTTVPSVRKTKLEEIEIDVPALVEQREIVDILAKLQKVINERQEQLEKLDDLIKARFVEMFGDPVSRLEKGETVQLNTLADNITVGFVGEASKDYVEEGIPYLRTQNVRVNYIDLSGLIYVNKQFHSKNQKSIIHPGDIVISRVGVNRGMAAVIPDSLPEANIANCLIVGKLNGVNPHYLAFYLNMSYGKRPQFGASVGSAQGVVNTSILKKWEIYMPDIIKQNEFCAFLKQVDKSKSVIQKYLDETQLLFDSLMQEHFG